MLARSLGARRAFLVTDDGVREAGHSARLEESLRAAGVEVTTFAQVSEDPDADDVERARVAAMAGAPDLLIGLGGGSAIDVAKGVGFLLAGGGRMEDYRGVGRMTQAMLPLMAIPTTSGTGTEAQSFALIAVPGSHRKMACGDAQALPRVALLDPELTCTQPRRVTALTGLDAIGHAVETWVTSAGTPLSMLHSREAFRLADGAFPRVLAEGGDLSARADMQLAAFLAGTAIERSMLGAAHSMANPLSSQFGFTHGHAVGVCLPVIVRFNAELPEIEERYAELAVDVGLEPSGHALAERLEEFLGLADLPASLRAEGVPRDAAPALAEEAAEQWTAGFNPRPIGVREFQELYEQLL